MREEHQKNGIETLASHRIQGVLPKKYHMEYRSGQEELVEEKSLQEIEDMIRETGKHIEVPEGLLPENMGRKLLFLRRKKRSRRRWMIAIAIMLLLCIVAFVIVAWKNRHLNQERLTLNTMDSYEQLYDHFVEVIQNDDPYALYDDRANTNLQAVMSAGSSAVSAYCTAIDYGFHDIKGTNLREKSVGEGDFTVTDGKYIYNLSYDKISEDIRTGLSTYEIIVNLYEIKGETVILTGTIQEKFQDMGKSVYNDWNEPVVYVYRDMLVLAHSRCKVEGSGWEMQTRVAFYDISNPKEPKFIKENTQSGLFKECREIDGVFFLISMKNHIMLNGRKKEKESRYLPMVDEEKIPLEDIYMQEEIQGNAVEIITSWDLVKNGESIDTKAVVGYFQDVYMTEKSIYFSNTIFSKRKEGDDVDYSQISKFSLEDGKILPVIGVKVPGTLDSSFAIQEKDDVLWVTVQREHYFFRSELERKQKNHDSDGNNLEERREGIKDDVEDLDYWYADETYRSYTDVSVYSFDKEMNCLDSLTGLAKGERVKAVRYVGDVGYFVSMEEKDPLVSVDISDPYNIKKLDELKMPGFSEYLHPLQDGLMIGFGRTEDNKLKLNLYDIEDPKDLSCMDEEELKDYWNCSVLDDYKWIMTDREKSLVGFSIESGVWGAPGGVAYLLYRYNRENGLEQVANISPDTKKKRGVWQGFCDGRYLYLVGKNSKKGKIQVVDLREI